MSDSIAKSTVDVNHNKHISYVVLFDTSALKGNFNSFQSSVKIFAECAATAVG